MAQAALDEIHGPIDTLLVVGGPDHDDAGARPGADRAGRPPGRGWPAGPRRSAAARSSWPRPGCSTAGGPPPTGWSPASWRACYPDVDGGARPHLHQGRRACGPPPGSAPAWIWRWRWWPTTTGTSWPGRSPAGWSSTCTGRAGRASSARRCAPSAPRSEPLRELQAFIDANPAEDLSVPALARRAGMSERHFSRVFTEQTGLSPGRYVERSRADTARRLLGDHRPRTRQGGQGVGTGQAGDPLPGLPPPSGAYPPATTAAGSTRRRR